MGNSSGEAVSALGILASNLVADARSCGVFFGDRKVYLSTIPGVDVRDPEWREILDDCRRAQLLTFARGPGRGDGSRARRGERVDARSRRHRSLPGGRVTRPAPSAVGWTYHGLAVTPLPETRRRVAGGTAIDIRIHDARTTATYATVNADNLKPEAA